jgi:hypothetical protein
MSVRHCYSSNITLSRAKAPTEGRIALSTKVSARPKATLLLEWSSERIPSSHLLTDLVGKDVHKRVDRVRRSALELDFSLTSSSEHSDRQLIWSVDSDVDAAPKVAWKPTTFDIRRQLRIVR